MKSIFTILSAFFLISCSGDQPKKFSDDALAAELVDLEGNETNLKNVLQGLDGKTVVKFWAAWCSDCIKSIPEFKKLQADNPEVNYLWLSVDYTDAVWKKRVAGSELQGQHYKIQGLKTGKDWKTNAVTKSVKLDWIPRYIVMDNEGNFINENKIVNSSKLSVEL